MTPTPTAITTTAVARAPSEARLCDEGPVTSWFSQTAESVDATLAAWPVALTRMVADYCCGGGAITVHLFGPAEQDVLSLRLEYGTCRGSYDRSEPRWHARRFTPTPPSPHGAGRGKEANATDDAAAVRVAGNYGTGAADPGEDHKSANDNGDDDDDDDLWGVNPLSAVYIAGDIYVVARAESGQADRVTRWDWTARRWVFVAAAPTADTRAAETMADRWLWIAGTSGGANPELLTWAYDTRRAVWHDGPKLPPSLAGDDAGGNLFLWVSETSLHAIWNDRFAQRPQGARRWAWDARVWLAAREASSLHTGEDVRHPGLPGTEGRSAFYQGEDETPNGLPGTNSTAAVWTPRPLPSRLQTTYGLAVYTGHAGRLQIDDGGGTTWVAPPVDAPALPPAPRSLASSVQSSGGGRGGGGEERGVKRRHSSDAAAVNDRSVACKRRRGEGPDGGAAETGEALVGNCDQEGGLLQATAKPATPAVQEWECVARALPVPQDAAAVFYSPEWGEAFYMRTTRKASHLCVYSCAGEYGKPNGLAGEDGRPNGLAADGVPRWTEVAGSRVPHQFTNAVLAPTATTPRRRSAARTLADSLEDRAGASQRWAALLPALFDLCAAHLETSEHLVVVERVCMAWRRASVRGGGWGHSLDLLALGADATWADAAARLGARLQPHRLVRLTCHDGLLVAEPSVHSADNTHANTDEPLPTASYPQRRRVFSACTHLTVVNARDERSLETLEVETMFPALLGLDVVLDENPAGVVRTLSRAPSPAVFAGSGDEADAAVLEAMTHHGRRGKRFFTRVIRLPDLPHVEHLRLAGSGWNRLVRGRAWTMPAVHLSPAPALRSLQTFGRVEIRGVRTGPLQLEHLLLRTFGGGAPLVRLVDAARDTLVSLVLAAEFGPGADDFHITLARCKQLRALHMLSFAEPWAKVGRELPAVVEQLAAGQGALERVGLYCCSKAAVTWGVPPRCRMLDMCATTTLRRLTFVDLSCTPESKWRIGTIHNPARTSYVCYGKRCCNQCLLSPFDTPLAISKCCA